MVFERSTIGGLLVLLAFGCATSAVAQIYTQPEQVHLSIGNDVDQMVVTWVTLGVTNESLVEFGTNGYSHMARGSQSVFVDGGSEKRTMYMHRVTMTGLTPQTQYVYHVGSSSGWSPRFFFSTLRAGTNWAPRFAMFGDMGNKNARSLGALQEEAQRGHFDMVLHVGDFAYDMDTDNAKVGDEFMRQIESVAAYVPYMTCAGNHEAAYNFSNYKARFTMPGGDGQGQFYSFNVGPVHLIYFDSEFYYFMKYGWKQVMNQYLWLTKDLAEANKPENRAKRPWIIAMAHRPMYCSDSDDAMHCTNPKNIIRVGLQTNDGTSEVPMFGLEDVFYSNGVDMIVAAHEHSYERTFPIYNLTVCNGTAGPYIDPDAPVHIITGSAGNREGQDPFIPGGQHFSAFRTDDFGYTRFKVVNATHLYLEQTSEPKGSVVDRVWIVKNKHGPGLYNCHTRKSNEFDVPGRQSFFNFPTIPKFTNSTPRPQKPDNTPLRPQEPSKTPLRPQEPSNTPLRPQEPNTLYHPRRRKRNNN